MPLGDIINIDLQIKKIYPDTYEELCKLRGYKKDCTYSRVYQFLVCNFSDHDGQADIDDDGNFYLEKVACPVRHTCKLGICHPVIDSILTNRENEIIKLFVKGLTCNEIAQRLLISPNTVHTHENNIYAKLDLVGKSHPDRLLVSMYYENKI